MAKVMIVDDNPSIRKLISILVSEAGHEVILEAENGLEALNAYFDLNPDLMIVDYQMPIMDGVLLIQEIAKENPNVNVVMCTASFDELQCISILDKVIPVLRKPFDTDEFIETVSNVLAS